MKNLNWPAVWFVLAVWSMPAFAAAQAVAVPQATDQSIAYADGRDLFWIAVQLLGLTTPLILLLTGWGARLAAGFARATRHRRMAQVALFTVTYVVIATAVASPLAYAEEWHRLVHDRSDLDFQGWMSRQATTLLTTVVVAVVAATVVYALLKRSPKRWWLWSTLLIAPIAAGFFILEPLATPSRPLENPTAQADVLALAARVDVPHARFVQQAGDGQCASGHLKGMGPTRRIVLEQGFMRDYSQREVLAVAGHELGHYVKYDDVRGWATLVVIVLIVLGGTHFLASAALSRGSARFGFGDLADPASLPLLVLCASLCWLAIMPVFNTYARHVEREADRYTAELGFAHEQASILARDADCYRMVPESNTFRTVFRSTHPSIGDRIRMLNAYSRSSGTSDAAAPQGRPRVSPGSG